MEAPRISFGRGCFAPRQSMSFLGDVELTWSSNSPKGFRIHGSCKSGPMGGSQAFMMLSTGKLARPLPLGKPGCNLFLDLARLLVFGPVTLDYKGDYVWDKNSPAGIIPEDPSLSGLYLYGQWAAVDNDWWKPGIYLSNAVKIQLPYFWQNGRRPDITTIYARGANAHSATSGTLLKNRGLVLLLGS